MATKSIAWNIGTGNITLTYQGHGNGPISIQSDANNLGNVRSQVINIGTTAGSPVIVRNFTVSQAACLFPVGDVRNFAYTGNVQSVVLPAGKYKLQCWGAQGGTCSSGYSGGKGGYSEGLLTLTSPTTVYIFVGGQGSSSGNGGWNGGGGGSGSSSYSSGNESGSSTFGCGGGATDIALVTSSMSYSSYRNNRSSASLLSRMIVAGGGSGGAYGHQEVTTSSTTYTTVLSESITGSAWFGATNHSSYHYRNRIIYGSDGTHTSGNFVTKGSTYKISMPGSPKYRYLQYFNSSNTQLYLDSFTNNSDVTIRSDSNIACVIIVCDYQTEAQATGTCTVQRKDTTSSTDTNSDSQVGYVGGGTNGGGYSSSYYGKQNGAGSNGSFGLGANQTVTNYRYGAGCGGGGWYGGGNAYSDSELSTIRCSGGGSGFVNTAASAGNRPSGYTGLQLDSGTTYAGEQNFPAVDGGNETGHSGNGYARITRLYTDVTDFEYTGAVQSKTLSAGTYMIECWGAQGGSYNGTYYGGKGGYSVGKLTISEDTTVYVYVGGQGTGGTTTGEKDGGFNGGGNSYGGSSAQCAGGGASDVRIGQDSLYARIIVAGGGGGAGTYNSSNKYSGGHGGGLTAGKSNQYSSGFKAGTEGTQTTGGTSYYLKKADSPTYGILAGFGIGAGAIEGNTYILAGGGSGWYGGGYSRGAGGAGGSGYVYTSATASNYPSGCLLNSSMYLTDANTIAGNTSMPSTSGSTETGHEGDGYVRITKIS